MLASLVCLFPSHSYLLTVPLPYSLSLALWVCASAFSSATHFEKNKIATSKSFFSLLVALHACGSLGFAPPSVSSKKKSRKNGSSVCVCVRAPLKTAKGR